LTQVNGQSYTYDNNGNLLNDGSRTFTYDTENRLTSVVSGAVTTTFEYNGDGDRYAQTVNGVTTDYVLDPVGLAQVLMETTSGQSKHYLPGLAQYDATNGWQYVTSDRVGSVRLLVKPNGEVALSQSFDPFGNVLGRTGAGQSVFGYTGEQTDPTGLVFLRARYYDPRVGRFLTADSIVPDPLSSMGWNRYAYVGNNSTNYVDPSGRCQGLSGAAFDVCATAVLAIAPVVHKANDYREDIFFPDANTTFAERLEASFVVGAVPLYAATTFIAPAIPIYATVGGVTGAGGNIAGQMINNYFIGGKSVSESWQSINWTDVKIAGGINFMAGGLAPGVGQTFWGNIGLGAIANSSQYAVSQ
jgi:RHS repeat-associated protein